MSRETSQINLNFPINGINVVSSRTAQPEGTCVNCRNVRVFDNLERRARGGIRPGLSKFLSVQIDGANRIQDINYSTIIQTAAPSATSLYVRKVKAVTVSNGTVAQFDSTGVNTATTTGARSLSSSSPFIFSTELFGRVYYTDGISYKIWVGANNTTTDWTASPGTLPGTDGTAVPRLVEMWRSRLVLSGLKSDPHNWFMSAVGSPLDFDYAPASTSQTQAATGGTGVVGKVGDVINCIIPYSDDVLIFGCDSSIWKLSGDPMIGGQFDLLADGVGMAFGRPWTKDDKGALYFFSTRGEVYSLNPIDGALVSLSEDSIDPQIINTNLNTNLIRMAWNPDEDGLNLFISGI